MSLQINSQEKKLGAGVIVKVSGKLSNNGGPMRRFMQTFVLNPHDEEASLWSAKKYYVNYAIFRYQEEEVEEPTGYTSTGPVTSEKQNSEEEQNNEEEHNIAEEQVSVEEDQNIWRTSRRNQSSNGLAAVNRDFDEILLECVASPARCCYRCSLSWQLPRFRRC